MKQNRRAIAVVALLVFGAIILGGCGGSGERLTRVEFARQLKVLCVEHSKKMDTMQSWENDADQLLANMVIERDTYGHFFAGLERLKPPLSEQPTVDKIMRLSKIVIKYHDDGLRAIKTHKGDPFENAAQYDKAISDISSLFSSGLGATFCSI